MAATGFAIAVGFTVIVNVLVGPTQATPALVNVGVTVMVATTGAVPVLTTLKLSISPVPNGANPMEGVLFVQEYVTIPPDCKVVKRVPRARSPLHFT